MDPIYLVVVICLVIEFTDVNGRTSEDVALDMETRDLGLAQVMTARMDTTVEPCVDFYQFTCGNWIESHDIPASQSRFDMFKQLKLNVSKTIMDSVEKTITDNDIKPIVDAKNYYQSCIDLDGIDNVGKAPLTRLLESLGGWPVLGDNPGGRWNASHYKLESLLSLMLREIGNSLLFSTHVSTETMQPSRRVIQFRQAHLPSFHLDQSNTITGNKFLKAYFDFMHNVSLTMGADENEADMQLRELIEFEIALVNFTTPDEDLHVVRGMTLLELQEKIPEFDWKEYLNGTQFVIVNDTEKVNVYDLHYLEKAMRFALNTDARTVSNYLVWGAVSEVITKLSSEFRYMAEEYSSVMFGRKLELERCEACVNHISYTMQFAIARIFVDERFDDESKANTNQIIDYIQDALLQMIDDASWMDELTKNTAKQKILLMHRNIGFPDWIKNDTELNEYYESLDFSPTDYFGNYLQYIKWGIKKNFESLRKPVDRTEWPFGPAKVNTFYNAAYNDLVLSAGILQGTFYHKDSPSYLNFGGIGAIIGHEMTHAVDAGGRMYNSSGNYMKWWSNSSIQAYVKLENCFLKQYSTYRVEECNINLNSHKTLGENIADNAGLKAAYMGYKLWVKDNGEEPWIPGLGFSPEQLFFINFGQVWCSKYTEQSARYQVLFGSHSPGRIRCNGSVMNSQEFSTTFRCPPGYMNPANKCSIW